ncbi:hypothetical protein D3C86_1595580 [compost metagenome]
MVTLSRATSTDRALQKAVSPARAAVDKPKGKRGDLTIAEVILTMRPKPRVRIPPTSA